VGGVRVILFGASGYTGRLTAAELGRRDVPLVLAGRSAARVEAVRDELAVAADVATADAGDSASVAALLEPGDVLVTTVGPFARVGRPAVQAAVAAGAGYLDSTGEHSFLRWLLSQDGTARASGATLVPAFGFDYLPGNLAGALAVEAVEGDVTGVRVGYFGLGAGISGGTRASALGMLLEPGYRWTGGRLVPEPVARRVRSFEVSGRNRTGVSIAGSEPLFLPRTFDLQEVEVYLGVPRVEDHASALSWLGAALSGASRVPGVAAAARALVDRVPGSTGGPSAAARARSRSYVVAEAVTASGATVGHVLLVGPDPYDLTAGLLAEGAARMLAGRTVAPAGGVLGPVEVFGVDGLRDLAEAAGMVAVESTPR
jgi:short subunit dehydrogenase-like uncharacterized protein